MGRIVIVGGGYAGLTAAGRLGTSTHDVTLVDARSHTVERVRLHLAAADGRDVRHALAPQLARCGVAFRQGRVDTFGDGWIGLDDGDRLPWDRLVLALGSSTPPAPGDGAHEVGSWEGAVALHARLAASPTGRVAVVGFGLTGLEVATEVAARHPGWTVDLLGRGSLDDDLSPDVATRIRERLGALGIALHEHADVTTVGPRHVDLAPAGRLDVDAVVWAAGFVPSPLPARWGLPTTAAGRVTVDDHLRVVGHPHVHAIGDLAAVQGRAWIRMGCVTAMPMGAWLGTHLPAMMAGRDVPPFVFGFATRCIGLGGGRAVLQATDAQDRPTRGLAGTVAGGLIKSAILGYTWHGPAAERRTGWSLVTWPQGPAPEEAVSWQGT